MTANKNMTKDFENWIDHYLNFEKHPQKNIFWLETMQFFCALLDHPELSSKSIHIAGSKGKGSVSAFISSILEAAGYKTGLYTSPHILDFAERVKSAHHFFREEIYKESARELEAAVRSVKDEDLPKQRAITWFELVTLYAFLCFRRYGADWSVYEVGLGGRLDATNVIRPEVCCITSLEKEHTEYLGNTIEEIAREKGGIIKEGVPVVLFEQTFSHGEAKTVIEKIATEKHAPLIYVPDVISSINTSYKRSEDGKIKMRIEISSSYFARKIETDLQLLGEIQAQNAAMAAIAIKIALPNISEEIIEKGLANAFLPARFEIISPVPHYTKIPYLIIDGAHTVKSISFLLDTLKEFQSALSTKQTVPIEQAMLGKTALLFGCAADKDVEDMARELYPHFDCITLTKPGSVKQCDLERIKKAFTALENEDKKDTLECGENYEDMIQRAFRKANEKECPLVVAGSFYLVAEVKKFLQEKTL